MERQNGVRHESARSRRRQRRRRTQRVVTILAAILAILGIAIVFIAIRSVVTKRPQSEPLESELTDADNESSAEPEETQEYRTSEEVLEDTISEVIDGMPIEDKIAQLFIVYPEQLTGEFPATSAGEKTREALSEYAVGGISYDMENYVDRAQITAMISVTRDMSRYPLFLAAVEEGGEGRSQLANALGIDAQPSAAAIGAGGRVEDAQNAGREIGAYAAECGFNTVLAPCANISPDGETSEACYGADASLVGGMAVSMMRGLRESGHVICVNNFPAKTEEDYGGKAGVKRSRRTLQEMQNEEFLPFRDCIMMGCEMVMLSNITDERVTGDETPMSLSENLIMGQLRSTLGFNGIVVTDRLNQEAITKNYNAAQAALTAFKAGADMLYCSEDFHAAYKALLDAANNGQITKERIDTSLRRIFRVKYREGFR